MSEFERCPFCGEKVAVVYRDNPSLEAFVECSCEYRTRRCDTVGQAIALHNAVAKVVRLAEAWSDWQAAPYKHELPQAIDELRRLRG